MNQNQNQNQNSLVNSSIGTIINDSNIDHTRLNESNEEDRQSSSINIVDQSQLGFLNKELEPEFENSKLLEKEQESMLINTNHNNREQLSQQQIKLVDSFEGLNISNNGNSLLMNSKQERQIKLEHDDNNDKEQKSNNLKNLVKVEEQKIEQKIQQKNSKKKSQNENQGEQMQQMQQKPSRSKFIKKSHILQQSSNMFQNPSSFHIQVNNSIQMIEIIQIKGKQKSQFINSRQLDHQYQQPQHESQYTKILQQLYRQMTIQEFLQKLANLSKSAISYKQCKILMDHIERHIDLLSLAYPKEIEYLRQILKKNDIQIVQRFKRIFPIRPSKSSLAKHLANHQERLKNLYQQYKLQQCKPGQYSKYLKLNLSYKQHVNIQKIVLYKWQNMIELNLKYCQVGNQGWLCIISQLMKYQQLRKLNLELNRITKLQKEDIQRFANLPHFMQLDISKIIFLIEKGHNPFQKQAFKHLILSKNFAKGKFTFQYSTLDFSPKMFRIQSFLKLQRQQLRQMQKIQWTYKDLNSNQWNLFVDSFRMFESIRLVNFSNNAIQNITFKQLQLLNSLAERSKIDNKRVTIILQHNPINEVSIQAIKQFYSVYKWSLICIHFDDTLSKQYHNKRLQLLPIKNQLYSLHFLILLQRQQTIIDEQLENLIENIDNQLFLKPQCELKEQNYIQEMFDYVIKEMKRRLYGDKKGKSIDKFDKQFKDIKEKFFILYKSLKRVNMVMNQQ